LSFVSDCKWTGNNKQVIGNLTTDRAIMRYLGLIFTLIFFCNQMYGQKETCDSIFQKTIEKEKIDGFKECENIFFDVLKMCPDYYEIHTEIIKDYETFYTAVPILALMWQNMIDYKSERSKSNIEKINYLSHKYLVVTRKGTNVHVPPKFVQDWDLDYKNNMSPLDAGFIVTGAIDFSKEHKKLNSSERLIQRFDKLFLNIDRIRSKHHGFYWDLYIDFLTNLYRTEHFRTAMYLIMYRTDEKEITNWINNNSEKVDNFYKWKQEYITEFISK
jgi:hypothetical protein